MRNRFVSLVVFLMVAMVFSSPAAAQVYFPSGTGQVRNPDAKKAAEASKSTLVYDAHDLSGIWRIGAGLMGGAPAPPMTAWGQEQFNALKKPTAAPSAPGADPTYRNFAGTCDPPGYPRSLSGAGYVEFVQTPSKMLQIFQSANGLGFGLREILTDGRTLPPDLDPRWYGWAIGHWEGDALVVESTGYDERAALDGRGDPHSEDMKLREVYRHPDALTMEITMTLDDSKAYTKPWVGGKQTLKLELPKGLTVRYESLCVPSEIENYNQGLGDPAVRDSKATQATQPKR
jgi:hypothetical protein